MRKKIIIILGEPNSISSEIFFKSLNYLKKINLNFIIIGNYSLLKKQANYLNFKIEKPVNYFTGFSIDLYLFIFWPAHPKQQPQPY